MIHFQYATSTRRAMMRAVWLSSLAFLTEARFACRFDGERREVRIIERFVGGQMGVSRVGGERRTWVGEDGCSIGPV